jgi:hypothetical protein
MLTFSWLYDIDYKLEDSSRHAESYAHEKILSYKKK